jgi:hypothetical protein
MTQKKKIFLGMNRGPGGCSDGKTVRQKSGATVPLRAQILHNSKFKYGKYSLLIMLRQLCAEKFDISPQPFVTMNVRTVLEADISYIFVGLFTLGL